MLEKYFIKPDTIDRIRNDWLGNAIEIYINRLHEEQYSARSIQRRVPLLLKFSNFAQKNGAMCLNDLLMHVDTFIEYYSQLNMEFYPIKNLKDRQKFSGSIVRHFLGIKRNRRWINPFVKQAPGFFDYLLQERGLSPLTIKLFIHNIRRFENYLKRIEVKDFQELSPPIISSFIVDSSKDLGKSSLRALTSNLRTFLSYLYQEDLINKDLSHAVESPTHYRLSEIPRCISWKEVNQLLESIDRRTPIAKRDYAIIILIVTYGLRAREIPAMTMDNIDWERGRIRISERKAGHFTAYPLSSIVGEAIIDYLKHTCIKSSERYLFHKMLPPYKPIDHSVVSSLVRRRLQNAGIKTHRPGSHTLRYTCVQRLIDEKFNLKTIGDYVGHGSPSTTQGYTKIDIASLRSIAIGDVEDIL